jgi:rod shape-determining protein MreB
VERKSVEDAVIGAGANKAYVLEEPLAAAIGARLPISEPTANAVVDIGGGTTEIAIISMGGIVTSKSLKLAGDKLNEDIIRFVREEFKLAIGEPTAEELKIAVGSVLEKHAPLETTVRGRDLITGLPREMAVTDTDVREAISQSIGHLIDAAKEVLETSPPEVISDVMKNGAYLVGGGALIKGMPELLSEVLKLPVYVADDPLTCVVRGTGILLENRELLKTVALPKATE